ncbi:hypothetical protein [Arthrobacter sp. D2-10]
MNFPTDGYASHSSRADWPFGNIYRSHADLAGHLHQVGQRHAQRALRLYTSEDEFEQLDAALSMGTSVELLAKSLLASVHPTLLLPVSSDVATLLKYSGTKLPGVDNLDAFQVKSLEATKAIERLRHIKLLPTWSTADQSVFTVRNAAAHMGLVQQNLLRSAVRPMVRFAEFVRTHYGYVPKEWWGEELSSIAPGMVEADALAWEQIVQGKLAAARIRISELKAGLPEAAADGILSGMVGSWRTTMDYNETTSCPGCGYLGWATGEVHQGSGETQYDEDGWPTYYSTLHVLHFECNVCGLKLADEAELEIAGVEVEIEFEDEHYFPEPDI